MLMAFDTDVRRENTNVRWVGFHPPLILGLKYCGKLPQYLCLPPWANVIKLFSSVIYWHSMVFTAIIIFYNTRWQQYHGMAVNYHSKKFHNIGSSCQNHHKFFLCHLCDRDHTHNTSVSSECVNKPNKLECLYLASLSCLMQCNTMAYWANS